MTEENSIDYFSIMTYALALFVASLGLLVWIYDIEFLIPNKTVPVVLNKPCAILFLMLAVIFFAVGSAGLEDESD